MLYYSEYKSWLEWASEVIASGMGAISEDSSVLTDCEELISLCLTPNGMEKSFRVRQETREHENYDVEQIDVC